MKFARRQDYYSYTNNQIQTQHQLLSSFFPIHDPALTSTLEQTELMGYLTESGIEGWKPYKKCVKNA